jgi:ABC-type transporter Mla MlaB component
VLRISVITKSDDNTRLQVEGRLVGPWVEELRRLSSNALSESKGVTLDLEKLLFVDSQGVALLRELASRNVAQLNCSPFILQQLQEADDARREQLHR